ncbi:MULTISPECIES: Rrf2 family transcriptional regulator [Pseudonocardia]|uniref:Transcriptional regulator, BadM/Rrf2 family n=1 Tax=Pseudonocardia oroxyli TaxID=366584 RepID=A0A1G8C857_PSEOR|nr:MULTISPECIES: Rrf2 family transcriptional regulator [Pseudonocardia]MCF7550633.1 Rrf2 family transcriptional regulator [Pseudonocardia sp. WMMC193]SDH41562.1 transcriptional regulator, BadM/Rrf2 family [Pseudonocardia oroxyli]
MRISAKADYALRALIELAHATEAPLRSEAIAAAQDIPHKFLEAILTDLRKTGFVTSQRGGDGGYRLRRAPEEVQVAHVLRAIDGPLTEIRGGCPEDATYNERASALQLVWVALRVNIRNILEGVTLAHLAAGSVPKEVAELTEDPEAWRTHWIIR